MVFQLLVKAGGWGSSSDSLGRDRVFEHTEDELEADFDVATDEGLKRIYSTPALLMPENSREPNLVGKLARITRVRVGKNEVKIEYAYDQDIRPIPMAQIERLSKTLRITNWEFGRTHWAIKEGDIFRILMLEQLPVFRPKEFKIDEVEVDPDLVAVMMPFDASMNDVFKTIKSASKAAGYKCERADDIWEHSVLIQDVVTLIARASVVICDCTARNANVFYEAGIAHSLGREVVLITQGKSDIPFDLQHHRFVVYLNNNEGRAQLEEKLTKRLTTLRSKASA